MLIIPSHLHIGPQRDAQVAALIDTIDALQREQKQGGSMQSSSSSLDDGGDDDDDDDQWQANLSSASSSSSTLSSTSTTSSSTTTTALVERTRRRLAHRTEQLVLARAQIATAAAAERAWAMTKTQARPSCVGQVMQSDDESQP